MLDTALLWPALASILALIVYFILTINVGVARAKYSVPAPQISGNPDFERAFRVQKNTLEQLAMFLPALWLFALTASPIWASGLSGGLPTPGATIVPPKSGGRGLALAAFA